MNLNNSFGDPEQPFDFNAAFGISGQDSKGKKRQKTFLQLVHAQIDFDFYYTRKIRRSSHLELDTEIFTLTIIDFVSEENINYYSKEQRDEDYNRLKEILIQEGILFV